MKVTQDSVLTMSVSDIKHHNAGHFFSRATMKFFGDKMASFGVRTFEGNRVLYRKPSALVNVFGKTKRAGRDYFGCWIIKPLTDYNVDIAPTTNEFQERFYNFIK